MSGAPTQPDAMLALSIAMSALVGPEAAVNAISFNQIAELPPAERTALIKEKRDEYAKISTCSAPRPIVSQSRR